jgi:hypothetical protein
MSQTAPPLRAAAYIRVSDDAQDKDGTPETRRFRILDYATKRSTELERPIEIVRWYLDVYTGAIATTTRTGKTLKRSNTPSGEGDLILFLRTRMIESLAGPNSSHSAKSSSTLK